VGCKEDKMMNKPAFHWKRGNVEKEQQVIFTGELRVESELIGIDCYKLCKVFNKLIIKKEKWKTK
jgi:hypothetical protein